jgi:predicted ABC-type exoprotein transport system permease subunit
MIKEQMTEVYKMEKRQQHEAYRAFLILLMGAIVVIGVAGIVGYFTSGNIASTIISAIGITLCIIAMRSKPIKAKMIYPISGR